VLIGSFLAFSVYDFGVKQKFLFPFAERLKLATLAGTASLVLIFAVGALAQILMVSKREDLAGLHLFWLAFVAGPLAGATLLGVLLSRGTTLRSVSRFRTIACIAVTPLIALCTFLVSYLIFTTLYTRHFTTLVMYSMLALCNGVVVVSVRWFTNFFYDVQSGNVRRMKTNTVSK
jgi:hypothetical protein